MKNILFVHYGDDWIRGSEVVLLDMLKSNLLQGNKPILWCNSKSLAAAASAIDVIVIVNRFVNIGYWTLPKWDFIQYLKNLLKAKRIIESFSIDVVHCNNGAPCQWMSPICKLLKVPLLLHLHARYQQRDRFILLFHLADRIIGVSKAVLDVFQKNEFSNCKLSVVYNGASPSRIESNQPFDTRKMTKAEGNDRVILFVGSLISRKGLEALIRSIAKVINSYSIKLAIFGSVEQKDQLLRLIDKLDLQNVVFIFPATLNVAELFSSNADYFVSTPTEEVFGLTLAEASMAGLPIVSTNVPGVNEIYSHEISALLVAPNNVEQLTLSIIRLIESPKLARQLAENANKHIRRYFSIQKQSTEIEAQYLLLQQSQLPSFISSVASCCKVFIGFSVRKLKLKLQHLHNRGLTHE